MNSDAPGGKFYAIENEVICLRAHFQWFGLEQSQVVGVRRCEGVVHGLYAPRFLIVGHQGKVDDAEPAPFGGIDKVEAATEVETKRPIKRTSTAAPAILSERVMALSPAFCFLVSSRHHSSEG